MCACCHARHNEPLQRAQDVTRHAACWCKSDTLAHALFDERTTFASASVVVPKMSLAVHATTNDVQPLRFLVDRATVGAQRTPAA